MLRSVWDRVRDNVAASRGGVKTGAAGGAGFISTQFKNWPVAEGSEPVWTWTFDIPTPTYLCRCDIRDDALPLLLLLLTPSLTDGLKIALVTKSLISLEIYSSLNISVFFSLSLSPLWWVSEGWRQFWRNISSKSLDWTDWVLADWLTALSTINCSNE